MRASVMSVLSCVPFLWASASAVEDEPDWNLSDLAWMEGCWEGPAFDGLAKECWVTGPEGHMTGLFQLEEEGKLVFTEIMYLREFEEGAGLAVKHFNPDFSGWEEKDGYHLFKLERTTASAGIFSGLTLRREMPDTLVIELKMKNKAGEVRTETMRYQRIENEVRMIPLKD